MLWSKGIEPLLPCLRFLSKLENVDNTGHNIALFQSCSLLSVILLLTVRIVAHDASWTTTRRRQGQ